MNRFQLTVKKTTLKYILQPITTGANSAMNQSQLLLLLQQLSVTWKNPMYKVPLISQLLTVI